MLSLSMKTVIGVVVWRCVTVVVIVRLVGVLLVGPRVGPAAPILRARSRVRVQGFVFRCSTGVSVLAFFQECPSAVSIGDFLF